MIDAIVDALLFFLPAMAANMAPVFAARYHWLPALDRPLDSGRIWRGKRLLGEHKTVRGLLVGILAGALIGGLQGSVALGALMGFGALLGDAAKSLVKRQLNIPSGAAFRPWDQIDFVIGAAAVTYPIVPLAATHYLIAIAVIGLGSYLTSYLGVQLNIKRSL